MTDSTPYRNQVALILIHAANYSVVMDLLSYSQTKLLALKDRWDELIFCDKTVLENCKALIEVTGADEEQIRSAYEEVSRTLGTVPDLHFVRITDDVYPALLKGIARPPLLLFLRGDSTLLGTKCVSVVGSRVASGDALVRARRVSAQLCKAGYTVASGLANGIDAAAHKAAILAGGKTVSVIGTSINKYYPAENRALQDQIAEEQLLVSQFPLLQQVSRYCFPERNKTMSGLSLATVIVEASDTSGALHLAKACLEQGRGLFIMKSLVDRTDLKWPRKFLDQGAIVLDSIDTLLQALKDLPGDLTGVVNGSGKPEVTEQLGLFAKA